MFSSDLLNPEVVPEKKAPVSIFGGLTQIAAALCGAPLACVALIPREQRWFQPHQGLSSPETAARLFAWSRKLGATDSVCIVPDLASDPRFSALDRVVEDLEVRFFASVALIGRDGSLLGFLCVLNRRPGKLGPEQIEALQSLARQVVREVQMLRSNTILEALRRVQNNFIFGKDLRKSFDELLHTLIVLTRSRDAVIGQIFKDPAGQAHLNIYCIVDPSAAAAGNNGLLPLHDMGNVLDRVVLSTEPVLLQVAGPTGPDEAFLGIPLLHLGKTIGFIGLLGRPEGYSAEFVNDMAPCIVTCTVIIEACRAEYKRSCAENLLRHEKSRLALTLSNIKDGVIAVSAAGEILLINRVAGELSGWTPADAQGRNVAEVFDIRSFQNPENSFPLLEALRVAEPSGPREFSEAVALRPMEGSVIPVIFAVWQMRAEGTELDDLLIILRDVREELELEQMKANFIRSVTHELRTPLTSITGFTSTVLDDPDMAVEMRTEFLGIVKTQAERLNSLVEKVVDFTKETRFKDRQAGDQQNRRSERLHP